MGSFILLFTRHLLNSIPHNSWRELNYNAMTWNVFSPYQTFDVFHDASLNHLLNKGRIAGDLESHDAHVTSLWCDCNTSCAFQTRSVTDISIYSRKITSDGYLTITLMKCYHLVYKFLGAIIQLIITFTNVYLDLQWLYKNNGKGITGRRKVFVRRRWALFIHI